MATRRHGRATGFFDGVTTFNQSTAPQGGVSVPAGATSRTQEVGRGGDNFVIYITTSGASTWTVQVAHTGDPSASDASYADAEPTNWHDLWYLGNAANAQAITVTFAGAGAIATLIPDFVPGWVRLKRTDGGSAVTVTAGWELQGD